MKIEKSPIEFTGDKAPQQLLMIAKGGCGNPVFLKTCNAMVTFSDCGINVVDVETYKDVVFVPYNMKITLKYKE